jgi:hypothetical protein
MPKQIYQFKVSPDRTKSTGRHISVLDTDKSTPSCTIPKTNLFAPLRFPSNSGHAAFQHVTNLNSYKTTEQTSSMAQSGDKNHEKQKSETDTKTCNQ